MNGVWPAAKWTRMLISRVVCVCCCCCCCLLASFMCAIADMRRVVNNSATGPGLCVQSFCPGPGALLTAIKSNGTTVGLAIIFIFYFFVSDRSMASSLDATTKRRPENFSKEISNASDTLRHKDEKWFWSKSTNRPIVGHDLSRSDTPPPSPLWVHPTHRLQSINRRLPFHFFSLKFEFFVEKFGRKSTRQVVAWWCVCTLTHTHPPPPPLQWAMTVANGDYSISLTNLFE